MLAVRRVDAPAGRRPCAADRPSLRPGADDQPLARRTDRHLSRAGAGLRLLRPQGCVGVADRLPDAGCDPSPRQGPADGLAGQPQFRGPTRSPRPRWKPRRPRRPHCPVKISDRRRPGDSDPGSRRPAEAHRQAGLRDVPQPPQAEIIEIFAQYGPDTRSRVRRGGDLSAYVDAGHLASAAGSGCPCRVIRAAAPATCTGPSASAAACGGSSTCPHRPASSARARTGTSTSRSGVRAARTSRTSWPWPADERACCGPCCVTEGYSPPPRRSHRRLDFVINSPVTAVR